MIRAVSVLFFILVGARAARAEFQSHDSVSVAHVTWNERMKLLQGTAVDTGTASYLGNVVAIDREWFSGRYGFGLGFSTGTGQTSSGDFDGVTTFADTGNRSFSLIGVTPRAFYRLTGQIELGVSTPIIYRKVDWASENASITVVTRRDLGMAFGADLRAQLTPSWSISQDMGFLSTEAETYWSFGIHYRYR